MVLSELAVERQIFYAVLLFSWVVYMWEAYLASRQVSECGCLLRGSRGCVMLCHSGRPQ